MMLMAILHHFYVHATVDTEGDSVSVLIAQLITVVEMVYVWPVAPCSLADVAAMQDLLEEYARQKLKIVHSILVVKMANVWMESKASSVSVNQAIADHSVEKVI